MSTNNDIPKSLRGGFVSLPAEVPAETHSRCQPAILKSQLSAAINHQPDFKIAAVSIRGGRQRSRDELRAATLTRITRGIEKFLASLPNAMAAEEMLGNMPCPAHLVYSRMRAIDDELRASRVAELLGMQGFSKVDFMNLPDVSQFDSAFRGPVGWVYESPDCTGYVRPLPK